MIGRRTLTAAAIATAVVGLAVGVGASAASASTPNAIQPDYSCNSSYCSTITYPGAFFYPASGVVGYGVSAGTTIHVSCYYGDSDSPDGVSDHVTYISGKGNVDGHIYDTYVNFAGHLPKAVGLPVC